MTENTSPEDALAVVAATQDPANQGDIPVAPPIAIPENRGPLHQPGMCLGADVCPDPFHEWYSEEELPTP